MVYPRGECPEGAELAAVLVRDDVVRVVRPSAVEAEAANRTALERLAGDNAVGAVGISVGFAQQSLDIRLFEPAFVAAWRRDRRRIVDRQLLGAERGEMDLRQIVAERPEQLGDDHFGAGGHPTIAGWIELDEPDDALAVADGEPGCDAVVLRRNDGPIPRRGAIRRIRAFQQLVQSDRPRADPVREPVGVHDLVYRVEVLRPDIGRLIS